MPDDVLRLRADLAEARIDVQALAQKVRVERSDADSPRAQLAEALAEHQSLLDKHNALHISARAARDEAEALRKDAERYRWMRDRPGWVVAYRIKPKTAIKEWRMLQEGDWWGNWWPTHEQAVDHAMQVDAAMGGQKEQG